MEWEWEQKDLGALGLAGIRRETSRVVRRAILPNFTNVGPPSLSLLFLVNAAALRALIYRADTDPFFGGGSNLRALAGWTACLLFEIVILRLLQLCTAAYVLCVGSLYCTGGDLLAADRVLKKDLPVLPLKRLAATFVLAVVTFFLLFRSLFSLALPLPLLLLGWTGAAHATVVFQLSCVVSVLEDAGICATPCLCGPVRRSFKLLDGKFWPAASVFVTLDACIIAVLKSFTVLVVDDALGLGLAFQVASAAAMFVALSQLLLVTMVAMPVVYIVCKSHHQEALDMGQLD